MLPINKEMAGSLLECKIDIWLKSNFIDLIWIVLPTVHFGGFFSPKMTVNPNEIYLTASSSTHWIIFLRGISPNASVSHYSHALRTLWNGLQINYFWKTRNTLLSNLCCLSYDFLLGKWMSYCWHVSIWD